MEFESIKKKFVQGKGHVFLVKLPDTGKPTALLGKRVRVDNEFWVCTGLESRGPARPGDTVCLIARPSPSFKQPGSGNSK